MLKTDKNGGLGVAMVEKEVGQEACIGEVLSLLRCANRTSKKHTESRFISSVLELVESGFIKQSWDYW